MSFGPGVSVGGAPSGGFGPVTVTSATDASAQITIDAGAALGPRAPVAQTGSEQATFAGGFSVLGTVTGAAPSVSILAPIEGAIITDRTPITGSVGGTFDPTMLLNGTAQIRLTALDASGQAGSTIGNMIVSGN